jgi:hypothetical protein
MGSIKEHRRRHGDITRFKNLTSSQFILCETLKTRVKLNLNFTRPHAITILIDSYSREGNRYT